MRFSIITICWNNLSGLKKTFESLELQTFRDFQRIVIDGNSTDGTVPWLISRPGTFEWVSEPDTGIYCAMNKGLKRCRGEYVVFMNSGDSFVEPETLSKIAQAIDRNLCLPDFVYGDSIDMIAPNQKFYRKARDYSTIGKGMFTQHQAMYFRADRLEGLMFREEYPTSADYAFVGEFLQKMRSKEGAVLKLNFPICVFQLGGVNETRRYKALQEDFWIRVKLLQHSYFTGGLLFILHFLHWVLKCLMPGWTRWLRYARKEA